MGDMGHGRRRSVDVGGLALALADDSLGRGWGGWDEAENGETEYAEVLIDVRAHTETMINGEPLHLIPDIAIEEDVRLRLIHALAEWNFEPHNLPDEEVLACAYILFEVLFRIEGMQEVTGVSLRQVGTFLQHLRQLYRGENSYHNFKHALDVFQATHYFLFIAGMVPSVSILLDPAQKWKPDRGRDPLLSCLELEDLFALHLAAIGHDVGHPGLSNAFMKNAKTPLAIVYDDKSVLEQMHYCLILQIMRHNGLGFVLDRPHSGAPFRKLLLGTIIATDMGVHPHFMREFRAMVDGAAVDPFKRKVLVCQALIKCADISNPSRPHIVAEHWAAALESEWSSQLLLEKHLDLPASVKPSNDRLGEARGQVWFIMNFARPLFELVAHGVSRMEPFARQCRENLTQWETRCSELSSDTDPGGKAAVANPLFSASMLPEDFLSAFPPTLPKYFLTPEDEFPRPLYDTTTGMYARSSDSRASSTSYASSHYETCASTSPFPSPPASPSDSSAPLPSYLPRLEITTSSPSHHRTPSIASTTATTFTASAMDATAAIRAAYKASVRKKRSFHRSSWNPSPTAVSAMASAAFPPHHVLSPMSATLSSDSNSPLTSSPHTPSSTLSQRPTLLSAQCPTT